MFIFYAITVSVLNMRFGGKPSYTCGIINNKKFTNLASKITLPTRWTQRALPRHYRIPTLIFCGMFFCFVNVYIIAFLARCLL
jgi:hypothetical protein